MKAFVTNRITVIFLLLTFVFTVVMATASGQHPNIIVSNRINNSDPQEPTIVINPKNTRQMLAGSNVHHYYYSCDGGVSWNHQVLTSSHGVWGDPCVVVDTASSFYYFHLSDPPGVPFVDRIVCQKLNYLGAKWSDGTFTGLNGTKMQDKEWAAVDRLTNNIYVTWTQFDKYKSTNPNDHTNIMFSRSVDGARTWSDAIQINKISGDCQDGDNTVEGAVPATGPKSEIYVSWAGPVGIVFDRSLDFGETWLDEDIFVSDIPGGWFFDVPGIKYCNGMPVTCCDVSNGPCRGNIYINWSDQRNGSQDTDIWLSKSTDSGNTWSAPLRINDDPPGKHQFFSWMAIDQTNGYIYVVFYDRRDYNDNRTEVYLAVSMDGGASFANVKISESPFSPNKGVFFGDYTNISAHNNVVRPIWPRMDNNDLSLWTALVNTELLTSVDRVTRVQPTGFEITAIHPNPFNAATVIQYEIPGNGQVVVKIYDILGKEVDILVNERQTKGYYHIIWNAENRASGIYFVHVEFGGELKTSRIVLAK